MAEKNRIKVEVTDNTKDGRRIFVVTVSAPTSDFLLTDLLRARGVMDQLDGKLKQAAKDTAENYLDEAELKVASLVQGSQKQERPKPAETLKKQYKSTKESSKDNSKVESEASSDALHIGDQQTGSQKEPVTNGAYS